MKDEADFNVRKLVPDFYKLEDLRCLYDFQVSIYKAITGKEYTKHHDEDMNYAGVEIQFRARFMIELQGDIYKAIH